MKDYDRLSPFSLPNNSVTKPHTVDKVALSYLVKVQATHLGTPYSVTGNGSCLFNAVSVALCGSEELSTELRYRTCIEMVLKKRSLHDYSKSKTTDIGVSKLRFLHI